MDAQKIKDFFKLYPDGCWKAYQQFVAIDYAMGKYPNVVIKDESISFLNLEKKEGIVLSFKGLKK